MIKKAWEEIIFDYNDIKNHVDDRGFVSKIIMQNLILGDEISNLEIQEDDFWIMNLEDVDYEVRLGGIEMFRPTSLRGKL